MEHVDIIMEIREDHVYFVNRELWQDNSSLW